MAIEPEPYVVAAEDAVELIGRSFSFTHHKGIVEWIKNSWDAYQRSQATKSAPGFAHAILEFNGSSKSFRGVRVIDFCGMAPEDIDRAFKRWFDMQASTGGLPHEKLTVLGGHGNGGKFYMRQMFTESRITTWLNGRLSQFGFDAKRRYGWVKGYKGHDCTLSQALAIARLPYNRIPDEALLSLERGETGFTVVEGSRAKGAGFQTQIGNVIESLVRNPQMLRLLPQMRVSAWHNDVLRSERLLPESPQLHPDIETVEIFLPSILESDSETFVLASGDPTGRLEIRVADQALSGRLRAFNRMDVVGRVAVVASYPVSNLPLRHIDGSEFLMATLTCPGVESEDESLVENERESLIHSPKTSAILAWVANELGTAAGRVAAYNAKERRELQAAETARLTRVINRYAQQFLRNFYTQITGGSGTGSGFGGSAGGGLGGGGRRGKQAGGKSSGGTGDDPDGNGGGSGNETRRASRFPEVLVAGIDQDPFSTDGGTLRLGERYPTLYQRRVDDAAHIYWINTEAVYPKLILDQFGESSPIWKNYVLLRHRDVVVKEALRHLTDSEGLDLTAENVNNRMDELTDEFLNSLDQAIADAVFVS